MSTRGRRLDIQGLRGLAVIPGFIYHMTDRLPGSMIFIDMFFAVSGYLITERLIQLAQMGSTKRYYIEFYKFRVKRLFPASITAIAITTLLAWLLFVPSRAASITSDAISGLFFYANIHFAVQGTDYMHRGDATSPLLPFWSLSMEEQFYVLWPVMVLLIIWWGARRQRERTLLVWASVIILVASFTYGFWFTRAHQVAAYYDTPSRCWDFAVGMLLAVYASRHRLAHAPDPARGVRAWLFARARGVRDALNRHASLVSWTGALIFFYAIAVTPTDQPGFPVPWGALGVIGAALVIFAGIDQHAPNKLLDNRFSAKLGDWSYSIYLVHFPVILIAASYLSVNKPMLYSFDVVATLGCALVLYYFVEEPGRQGFKRTRAWVAAGTHRPVVNAVAVCAATATVLFAVAPKGVEAQEAVLPPAVRGEPSASLSTPPAHRFADPDMVTPTADIAQGLTDALALGTWPHLSNEGRLDNVGDYLSACSYTDISHPPCIARPASGTDPAKVAVAVGDSTMTAYWGMLTGALVPRGWTVVMLAHPDCPAAMLEPSAEWSPDCTAYHASFESMMSTWKPNLVLMTAGENVILTLADRAKGADPQEVAHTQYVHAMTKTVQLAQRYGARPLILSAPPGLLPIKTPSACLVAGSSPLNCVYAPRAGWFTTNQLDHEVALNSGSAYADLLDLFCVDLRCPGIAGDVAIHADKFHITPEYAATLAPSFTQFLSKHGLAG